MSKQVAACSSDFNRKKWDIKNIKNICKKPKHSESWVGYRTLPLGRTKKDSQILVIIGKIMRSKVFFNWMIEFDGTRSYRNCRAKWDFKPFC